MSIIIEPQILDVYAVQPVNVEVSGVDTGNISISTGQTSVPSISAPAYSDNYEALSHKPKINGITLVGDKSSEELLIKEDANFLYTQTTASDEWVIVHNLNKFPSVTVIDSAGNEVVGEVIYNDTNQVTLKFEGGFKGTATLN